MVLARQETVRYAITDLSAEIATQGFDAQHALRLRWTADLRRWARQGVDFVQLREKHLEAGELLTLAMTGMALLRELAEHAKQDAETSALPRLLINGRPDIAAVSGADGVHLTGRPGELRPAQVREIFRAAGRSHCLVSVSCHTPEEAAVAAEDGADLILFGPVFEKRVREEAIASGVGLQRLCEACRRAAPVPVLALGGVDRQNADACLEAAAAGIAGIRLFA